MNKWKEQFDKEFEELYEPEMQENDLINFLGGSKDSLTIRLKDFISKEIESAKKVERERIVEALEGLKLETDIFYSKCTPIQVLDQVINLINK